MQQLQSLLNNIVTHGITIGGSFLIVAIMFVGYNVIWGGREGIAILKKYAPGIIIGALLIFGATGLAAWIRSMIP